MTTQALPRNRLLAQLARENPRTFAALLQQLEAVTLEKGSVVGTARARTEFVYFVESGVVSLVASTRGGQSIEVAVVGREGVAGIADALGQNPLPYGWVVQLGGTAYRAPTRILRDHILSCTDLHALLMTYSQVVMHELALSAVCSRFHTSVQRLARWLLLTSERAEADTLELTHEYLAHMVGAPRSAVTKAAATLRSQHVIDYRRGMLTIRDRKRLNAYSCECASLSVDVSQLDS